MSTLRDLVEEHTDLVPADIDHLHRLAGDWQLLSDLSFADLLMWVPVDVGGFRCVAQVRPTTAPTVYLDDQVGRLHSGTDMTLLVVVPVRRPGDPKVIALLGRNAGVSMSRTSSELELNYLTIADDLIQMVADGTFPLPPQSGDTTSAPRVGDGLIRLDADGKVVYASPNAQSAYRRLGFHSHLTGEDLTMLTGRLADDPLEGKEAVERISAALRGESPPRKELDGRGTTLLLRALPLLPGGRPIGAVVLVRDITEVRRRDRALVSKDATIREIHHRVKNNLQTVAALLRLQARRVDSSQAKAALEESVRRVASIALVHETLSMGSDETVEFDTIVDRVASMAAEISAAENRVIPRRKGTFGVLPSEIATPLVMVLNELLQNAVEHAYGPHEQGEVVVSAHRWRRQLHVTVSDSGRGLPEDFDLDVNKRLGLQIVRALATGELRGTIELRNRVDAGMEAVLVVPLSRR